MANTKVVRLLASSLLTGSNILYIGFNYSQNSKHKLYNTLLA